MSPAQTLNLTIAGTRLEFCGSDGLRLAAVDFEYPPFIGEHPFDRRLTINVSRADAHNNAPPAVDEQLVFDTADGWMLTRNKDTHCVRMPVRGDGAEGADVWRLSWQAPLRSVEATVHADLVHDGVVHHLAQYPLDQILLTTALAEEGALLMHACGGMTRAGGLAFAGVSGAGKSTVTRLLAETPGTRFFSDDRLFMRPTNGAWTLHGTPWAGDAHAALNERTPLDALIFLSQSGHTELKALPATSALDRLLPVCTLPWFDAQTIGPALDACAALVEGVPCYELRFTPERDALLAAIDELARA